MTKAIKIIFFTLALQLVFFVGTDFLHAWPNRAPTKDLVYERFATLFSTRPHDKLDELLYTTNLLDYFHHSSLLVKNSDGSITLKNNTDKWQAVFSQKIALTCPTRISIDLSASGGVGSITLNGQMGTGKSLVDWWKGQIYLRLDQKDSLININVLNGQHTYNTKTIVPEFPKHQAEIIIGDTQGKDLFVRPEDKSIFSQFDIYQDKDLQLPKGLFPQEYFYLSIQAEPKARVNVHRIDKHDNPSCSTDSLWFRKFRWLDLAKISQESKLRLL